ncbi:MAG: M20/M25/M40 family metallo-hydrolase [Betaproteobacteria bacterium]|nr:M20/M25/M40 family metallo-hydrolase [Betaproteobacteria bacterium]
MNSDATTTLHMWMRAHEDDLIDFLRRIVNMDTSTANRPGVEALAALMATELAGLGFAVERPAGVRPEQDWLDAAFMGAEAGKGIAPGVVGRLAGGTGRGKLLLIAHLDTAFPPGSPAENPFRIDNERAYGTAVADMKGGVAGILFACRALLATGAERPAQITVLFDTDEQAGSIWSRPLIEAEARAADWGLDTEPGRAGGQVVGQRAGIAIGELVVEGVEAHLGTGYKDGRSAIEALCRKVIALHRLHDPDRGVLLNVGEFAGGTRRNLYAGRAVARLDARVTDAPAWERLRAEIAAIAAADDVPGTRCTLKLWQHRPPMPWTPQTDRLAALVNEAAAALGTEIPTIATLGASDANLIAGQGTPTLCGLGPVGGAIMTRGEYIELPTLAERATLVAALAHKLSRSEGTTA